MNEMRQALIGLLEIKDSDIRIMTIEQGRDAVDRGIHIGGAMSATVPLVALYYSRVMRFDVQDPTRLGDEHGQRRCPGILPNRAPAS